MQDCKPMSTPMAANLKNLHESASCSKTMDPTQYRQLFRSLMYLVHTRPNICYAVSALIQFMFEQPKHIHWTTA